MAEAKSAGGFKKGDAVSWKSQGGTAHGKVERVATSPTKIKTHKVAASRDNPELIVKSEKGGRAAHKPSALTHEKKS